jgi:hypothetical protein
MGAGTGPGTCRWLLHVLVETGEIPEKLREHQIESNQMHYRNDRYSIFGGRVRSPQHGCVEDTYLVLPLPPKMTLGDVERVCSVIKSGWCRGGFA